MHSAISWFLGDLQTFCRGPGHADVLMRCIHYPVGTWLHWILWVSHIGSQQRSQHVASQQPALELPLRARSGNISIRISSCLALYKRNQCSELTNTIFAALETTATIAWSGSCHAHVDDAACKHAHLDIVPESQRSSCAGEGMKHPRRRVYGITVSDVAVVHLTI